MSSLSTTRMTSHGPLTSMTNAGYTSRTNFLSLRNMASIVAPSVFIQSGAGGGAEMRIQSGQLFVTNAAGNGNMTVNGRLFLNGGLLRADKLTATHSSLSRINIAAGKAEWAACDFAQGIPLRIGNDTNVATLNLLGGSNLCRSGLEICRYSRLSGSGVVTGVVTNRGALLPGALAIQGDLLLNSTSESGFSLAGPPGFPQNSSLTVTGVVSLAGKLTISIAPGTVLDSSQTFVLIQAGIITSNFSNVVFGQRLLTSDRLASFRIDNTGSAIVATDFRSEDLEGDGIQDAWAMQYFGKSPLLPGNGVDDLNGDSDGDGLSNHDEFLLGTNPKDASSRYPTILEMTPQRAVSLHFPYLPNFSYSVYATDDLVNWSEIPVKELRFDLNGLAVWDALESGASGKHFYRLSLHAVN